MKPILHLGDTSASKFVDVAARAAGPRATLTDAPFVADVTGKAGDRDLERLAKSDSAKDEALLKESVSKTGAVVANMKGVAKDKLKDNHLVRVLRAAFRANVPIMLENTDAELMAELMGLGLGYEAIIIEPSGEGNDCHITCVGESYGFEPSSEGVTAGAQEVPKVYSQPITDPEAVAKLKEHFGDAPANPDWSPPQAAGVHKIKTAPGASDSQKVAAKFQDIIQTRPYAARRQREKNKLGLLGGTSGDKAGGYLTLAQKKLGPFATTVFSDNKQDEVAVDVTFRWTLARGGEVDGKYLNIKPESVSVNPSPMAYNEWSKRGAFTEKMVLAIKNYADATYPKPASLVLIKHEPLNANNLTTYCYTTGFSVANNGVTFSGSSAVTTSIPDFTITDNTSGTTAQWIVKLSMTDGVANPGGAFGFQSVNSFPALATNNFTLLADTVFRVDPSFMGQAYFVMSLDLTATCCYLYPVGRGYSAITAPQNGHFEQWMRVNFGTFGLMW